jgi:hypothetical protein
MEPLTAAAHTTKDGVQADALMLRWRLAHAFIHTQNRVSCPSRVLCERARFLADIAAADYQIHAKLLTTTRRPVRFPFWNRVLGQFPNAGRFSWLPM